MASLAAFVAAAFCAGCSVPLGPGFLLNTRRTDVSSLPAQPAHIHVRVTDQLQNIGDRSLPDADVSLPESPTFGIEKLNILVDGRPANVTSRPGALVRVHFDPAWSPKQLRIVAFDYEYASKSAAQGSAAGIDDAFYLVTGDAFPKWAAPAAPLAKGLSPFRKEQLDVTVPREFSVISAGLEERPRKREDATIHRFQISPAASRVFLIAGRYHEQLVRTKNGDVTFWTLSGLDTQAAQAAAAWLAATNAIFIQAFGPAAKNSRPLRIVEAPGALPPLEESDAGIAALSFPEGVLLDTRSFAQGIATEPVLAAAEYELAQTWFGWLTSPGPGAVNLTARGPCLFATLVAAEARGGEAARRTQIARFVAAYDQAKASDGQAAAQAQAPSEDSTREKRLAAAYKDALFWVALEDVAGKQNFESAVQHVLNARAGADVLPEDLRSSLEAVTGRDFAGIFRNWDSQRDLPRDFRARYSQVSP